MEKTLFKTVLFAWHITLKVLMSPVCLSQWDFNKAVTCLASTGPHTQTHTQAYKQASAARQTDTGSRTILGLHDDLGPSNGVHHLLDDAAVLLHLLHHLHTQAGAGSPGGSVRRVV